MLCVLSDGVPVSIPSSRGVCSGPRPSIEPERGMMSQSPQVGAFVPAWHSCVSSALRKSLNPLKSGRLFRPVHERTLDYFASCLNPLKSGRLFRPNWKLPLNWASSKSQSPQVGAFVPAMAFQINKALQDYVSIPSSRGVCSGRIKMEEVRFAGNVSIPSSRGVCSGMLLIIVD